ncbi:MAG: histidine--tRNA ligase family protein, partial [Deltaproteobacteria bacterium]|nr:histidine--tRNA ligase family protein [Deltaproteobacteria bacterium]
MGSNSVKTLNTAVLSGFMELLPAQQLVFDHMRAVIARCYGLYGFTPLDTPVIERAEVLLAKAGGETEKQIYQFRKGDHELALRFDLTVPLARYVSEHLSDLTFPFRRYQIGKVYRGERPQKGRFREFYQCDIDIIGRNELSLVNDAEILCVIYTTFCELGLENVTIRLNNRKLLNGLFGEIGVDAAAVLRVVDKLEKIGKEAVCLELAGLGVAQEKAQRLVSFLQI